MYINFGGYSIFSVKYCPNHQFFRSLALSKFMKRGTNNKVAKFGQIRIVSGQWRGRKLPVLNADGLRPTTDRVKETVFNWLSPYLSDRECLDLFAGTGSLGIESLSRYAKHCQFVEKNKHASDLIIKNMQTLKVDEKQYRVFHTDALRFLETCKQTFNLIFIDPPYNQGLAENAITMVERYRCLAPGGLIYIETELGAKVDVPDDWQCIKQSSTKTMVYQLYEKKHD